MQMCGGGGWWHSAMDRGPAKAKSERTGQGTGSACRVGIPGGGGGVSPVVAAAAEQTSTALAGNGDAVLHRPEWCGLDPGGTIRPAEGNIVRAPTRR